MEDAAITQWFGAELATLPGVRAVTLGGSRAIGTSHPASDWDFAIYYRRSWARRPSYCSLPPTCPHSRPLNRSVT